MEVKVLFVYVTSYPHEQSRLCMTQKMPQMVILQGKRRKGRIISNVTNYTVSFDSYARQILI